MQEPRRSGFDLPSSFILHPSSLGVTMAAAGSASIAAPNIANGQVTAGVAAATLLAARPTRHAVLIKNLDAAITVYVGAATVTTANGMPLKPGESISIDWTGLIQGIAASGTPKLAYLETYD